MTLKEKAKTYNFWISLVSCLLLIAKLVAEEFGYIIDQSIITTIVTSICALLVLLGIVISPNKKNTLKDIEKETNKVIESQQKVLKEIKGDAEKMMEDLGKMTIAEQIEYLKKKLEEEKTAEDAVAETVENVVEEQPQIEEQCIVEQPKERVEEIVEIENQAHKEHAEEIQQEHQSHIVDLDALTKEQLKQLMQELFQRL